MPEPPAYIPPHALLDGKTVLVTAAAGAGIGFATAKRCAEEGRGRQHEPVIRADDQPHDVRHDEADEEDRAAERHRGAS